MKSAYTSKIQAVNYEVEYNLKKTVFNIPLSINRTQNMFCVMFILFEGRRLWWAGDPINFKGESNFHNYRIDLLRLAHKKL